jgi:hypothetical protein
MPADDALSDCWAAHIGVAAICQVEAHRCYWSAAFDLIALILKHGDVPISDLRHRLVCQVCERRSFRL